MEGKKEERREGRKEREGESEREVNRKEGKKEGGFGKNVLEAERNGHGEIIFSLPSHQGPVLLLGCEAKHRTVQHQIHSKRISLSAYPFLETSHCAGAPRHCGY